MNEIFKKDEAKIEKLTKRLENIKYTKECFIELIDDGAEFTYDKSEITITLKMNDRPDKSEFELCVEYYSKLSNVYNTIQDSINKVNIKFKPVSFSYDGFNKILILIDNDHVVKDLKKDDDDFQIDYLKKRMGYTKRNIDYSDYYRWKRIGYY